jgi:queuine tRNA-ribosyltransferase
VARNGQLWTWDGRLNLRNARFLDDALPVDAECGCETCRTFSRGYLAHLFRAEELLAYRLASLHNLTFTLDLMARLRLSLADGTFGELGRRVTRAYSRR